MIRNNSLLFPTETSIRRTIDQYTRRERNIYLDAGSIAESLFGDHMSTNIFLLGVAYQAGFIPLKAESIEQAMVLNGVAVAQNQQAFRYGRRYVYAPEAITEMALPRPRTFSEERLVMVQYLSRHGAAAATEAYQRLLERCSHLDEEAQRLLAVRIGELIDYQHVAYATTYVDVVLRVAHREADACPGNTALTHAVIRSLYKLMAYKDEYEVARLHLKQAWREHLHDGFEQPHKVYYHLHPPLLRALGLQRKLKLGPWFDLPLRCLMHMKKLRGSVMDLFGYAKVRRAERALIPWYRDTIDTVLSCLDDQNHDLAVVIANAPDAIRGYETIKLSRIQETQGLVAQHVERLVATPRADMLALHPKA
jgi:indolepyruvate ferredoxin oxidoreductase